MTVSQEDEKRINVLEKEIKNLDKHIHNTEDFTEKRINEFKEQQEKAIAEKDALEAKYNEPERLKQIVEYNSLLKEIDKLIDAEHERLENE
ncbi:hypothetical protein D3C80_2000110 [compost metagenome]